MKVRFYKTKLSAQNRCYGKLEYGTYLSSCDSVEIDIPADIIPNTTFYVPPYGEGVSNRLQWQLCNYITFVYAGMIYGSFITSIQPLASNATVAISHTTDNWYYLMMNFTDDNYQPLFDMHGQMERGHVNDIVKKGDKYYPVLSNTYMKREEDCTSLGYANSSRQIIESASVHYIYVLVNNPNQTGFTGFLPQIYQSGWYKQVRADKVYEELQMIGGLFVGTLAGGVATFYCAKPNESLPTASAVKPYQIQVQYLQSDSITKILVSDIPPSPQATIKLQNTYYYIELNDEYEEVTFSGSFLPSQLRAPTLFYSNKMNIQVPPVTAVSNTFEDLNYDDDSFLWTENTPITLQTTYNTYIRKGISKLHSAAYNSLSVAGNEIDFSFFKPTSETSDLAAAEISLSVLPSLTAITFAYNDLKYLDYRSSYVVINVTSNYTPVVTRSIFDSYDLSLATLNAKRKVTNAGFDVAAASFSVAEAGTSAIGKAFKGDIAGAIGGGIGTAATTSELFRSIGNLNYERDIQDLTLRKAEGQIQNGNISTDTAFGYYAFSTKLDFNNISLRYLNGRGRKQICPLLHKYGYNTPLQLEEVYKDHQRNGFNYFLCSSCEVEGVPLDIASDVSAMFKAGVHLWTSTVGNWEVVNYQKKFD